MSDARALQRHAGNPILTADDWPYPVNAVFNPAAARLDGETVLLARVEDRRGISHLSVARSANGVDGWSIAPEPLLAPDEDVASEQWGFEDPRVIWAETLERWVITCTAYGPAGPAVYLATTEDFTTVERYGIVRHPEDKNAALLPHQIDGRWVLFHRPKTQFGGAHSEIVLSRSADLESWSAPEQVLQPRDGRVVGLAPDRPRPAAASAPSTAGSSSTTGSRRRSPARSTASAWRCSTSTSRPGSCAVFRTGSSRRRLPTSGPATFRTSCSRAA